MASLRRPVAAPGAAATNRDGVDSLVNDSGDSLSAVSASASALVSAVTANAALRYDAGRPLLRDLADLVRLRALGLVRVLRPGVHLELLQHRPPQRVARQHASYRLLDRLARILLQQRAVGHRPQAA